MKFCGPIIYVFPIDSLSVYKRTVSLKYLLSPFICCSAYWENQEFYRRFVLIYENVNVYK